MVSIEHQVEEILRTAESRLRGMMAQALTEERFYDVAHVASTLARLGGLIDDTSTEASKGNGMPAGATRDGHTESTIRPTRGGNSKWPKYPRFERDGDRFIKVGWSKKDRREYEHRASKKTVKIVTGAIEEAGKDAHVFNVEDLLPIRGTDGDDVPSYQVYITLAWLRDVGMVTKKGKDGYTLSRGRSDSRVTFDEIWATLETR